MVPVLDRVCMMFGGVIALDSSVTGLRCWRFLLTCPVGVSIRYDLGVFADDTTRPGTGRLSVVIYTSLSSGMVGSG